MKNLQKDETGTVKPEKECEERLCNDAMNPLVLLCLKAEGLCASASGSLVEVGGVTSVFLFGEKLPCWTGPWRKHTSAKGQCFYYT